MHLLLFSVDGKAVLAGTRSKKNLGKCKNAYWVRRMGCRNFFLLTFGIRTFFSV